MKKSAIPLVIGALLTFPTLSFSQQKHSKLKQDIQNTADTISTKAKQAAAKGAAKVTDQTYADKVGPHGETIYMDNHAKYYYIDSKGEKVYITKSKMKNKPPKR